PAHGLSGPARGLGAPPRRPLASHALRPRRRRSRAAAADARERAGDLVRDGLLRAGARERGAAAREPRRRDARDVARRRDPGVSMTPGRAARAAALLLGTGLFAGLAHLGVRDTSPTFDEVAHLPAGYTHLTRLDFRLVPEQPPLVKDLAALPLLAMDVRVPEQDAAWARRRHYEFGRRFLFEWNDGQRLAAAGRHAMLACAVLLLGLVAACASCRWGGAVGGVALLLGVLHPDLLAHGPLVT